SFFTISILGSELEIPSSFNPVGSGARAIGMGGAFIAVADDATAASWNPGGLIQLILPEFSVVTSGFHRGEDIDFGTNPEGAGSHRVSELDINYFSAAYPFNLFKRNMVVSLSYQHLYDFNREWRFTLLDRKLGSQIVDEYWDYEQNGSLSAVGLSYCIQIIPELSMGVTLNLWEDSLTDNQWKKKYNMTGLGTWAGASLINEVDITDIYSFSGFNVNIGVLWRVNYKLSFGAVLKTPFTADVEHRRRKYSVDKSPNFKISSQDKVYDEELDMPASYGIGFVYRFSDKFLVSADGYRTEWNNFVHRDGKGEETSPVSGREFSESDISSTHQVRIGLEYRVNNEKGYIIPIRGGIFYDPAPTEDSPDDFYGFSLGSGFTLNDKFSVDIAYQYRYGDDVGSILEEFEFSQDVSEHTIYFSLIYYL
ncbi:MAG: hypothetical protein GY749_45560, partial [Desulfobacteraceae bacterium]|nr:hypothetical protein [Desulfobacteraceae bacterium]